VKPRPLALPVMALLAAACGSPSPTIPPPGPSPSPVPAIQVIAAAGDISCAPGTASSCRQMDTATAVGWAEPDIVLALGDNQYESGELPNYLASYAPSWGRFKAITRPVAGNHEYQSPGAAGYYDYFDGPGRPTGAAGERGRGFYSYDLGGWHMVALNSNCRDVGGCQAGSAQEAWLRADLKASASPCTLAYFHHPLFASGPNGNSPQLRPLWQALYDFDADVVLNGHDHIYERFAPQTPEGAADPVRGIRQFVVGTGGHSLTRVVAVQPNSEVRNAETFGVLRMELGRQGYRWEFLAAPGGASTFTDTGVAPCH
jgi:hypothetical protein